MPEVFGCMWVDRVDILWIYSMSREEKNRAAEMGLSDSFPYP